ncbi:MAG: type IV pili twitching motility protein PilT [Candidatus Doudnabacteria bacterium RIFCSPLOWO2_02_FULL_49_13]|uniref:Type IV pili twitching motility protein PilT n=1 Tax=Candidatus Doudnabacteria bacterium RIFCSPHIGHO2_12_FULL_48_16 TaxID=1817838 RepID=A0A1F5PKM7_9BACT|nr:MAG: type IV pili twitching motility protein PilT [Candidatus Doudnabacteria bacterium RIFCSPHIGHO2_02_FULL_49_24]OGE88174.1 MAG: type IV pili twitching motility protein PilT [Candidatus Doudnabacteria bacterium RIFCSPHIGHO2_01_FULL_50_67]OGE90483.1 MAG: type IV pili twitching motility protein PilT [Candidatus Doudnabacteria bacterium RIFCSPHIGHO2_12_FULL_48_16]OGE96545.1 MAG: type IV pili twitching motility protein PilT [Candidatus Doudnabacteria bacterium RIFCSPLOWO2_01_FULL_49_40]OGF02683
MVYTSIELEINNLLMLMMQRGASDLHLIAGKPPTLRIDSRLEELADYEVLSGNTISTLVDVLLDNEERKKEFRSAKELDFSFAFKDNVRFRINAYYQKGYPAAALRLISNKIKTVEELNLPPSLKELTNYKQGLILLVGPTGSGKSTTLAAMIDLINQTRAENIVTVEDPIEYVYVQSKSLINQREVGEDTNSFTKALRSVLREDANVVLVGEMRDLESISTTITIAETGHLVFATLHTNNAAQTIDRIIDVFPAYQQNQIRNQLANILMAVISQRLMPKTGGGRIPAVEIMMTNNAVANVIRENKTYELPNIIHTGSGSGMVSMDADLARLVRENTVKLEDVLQHVSDQDLFESLLRR